MQSSDLPKLHPASVALRLWGVPFSHFVAAGGEGAVESAGAGLTDSVAAVFAPLMRSTLVRRRSCELVFLH